MPPLKVKFSPTGEIEEAEGAAEEIADLQRAIRSRANASHQPQKSPKGEAKVAKEPIGEPSVDAIKKHIAAQPQGRHNAQGTIKSLTGVTLSSRAKSAEERTAYGRWLRALEEARVSLEKETGRSFVAKGAARGQYYLFADAAEAKA